MSHRLANPIAMNQAQFISSYPSSAHLVEYGFDSKMGARPMQRYIDKHIKRPLSKLLLFGDLRNGGTLKIDVKDDKLILKPITIKVKNEVEEVTNN